MRFEDTLEYKTMIQNRTKQEEELIQLIKYETIGDILTVEWNIEIADIRYYKSKQNELKRNVELIEDTLKNVNNMKSIFYQGKTTLVTSVLNNKLTILKNMVPQMEIFY